MLVEFTTTEGLDKALKHIEENYTAPDWDTYGAEPIHADDLTGANILAYELLRFADECPSLKDRKWYVELIPDPSGSIEVALVIDTRVEEVTNEG